MHPAVRVDHSSLWIVVHPRGAHVVPVPLRGQHVTLDDRHQPRLTEDAGALQILGGDLGGATDRPVVDSVSASRA